MTVRVALAQFSGHIDKNVNIEKAENLARQAAGNGAKVVCFPELCTTIYFCFDRDKKWFETAEPVPGPAVDRLRKVARETGTVIVYPLYENDNGVLYNTAVVIGPDGGLIGKYRKMSIPQILRTVKSGETPGDERFFFQPGGGCDDLEGRPRFVHVLHVPVLPRIRREIAIAVRVERRG